MSQTSISTVFTPNTVIRPPTPRSTLIPASPTVAVPTSLVAASPVMTSMAPVDVYGAAAAGVTPLRPPTPRALTPTLNVVRTPSTIIARPPSPGIQPINPTTTVRPPTPTAVLQPVPSAVRPPSPRAVTAPIAPVASPVIIPPNLVMTAPPGITPTIVMPPIPVPASMPPIPVPASMPPIPVPASMPPIPVPMAAPTTMPMSAPVPAPVPMSMSVPAPVPVPRTVNLTNVALPMPVAAPTAANPLTPTVVPTALLNTPIPLVTPDSSRASSPFAPPSPGLSSVLAQPSPTRPGIPGSVVIPASATQLSYQALITDAGLEGELVNARYQIDATITLSNERGEKRVQYIKAINPNGQRVYILIDINGYLPLQRNFSMVILNGATRVPHSIKSAAFDCVSNLVAGAAFEVGVDGLCTVIRDVKTLEVKEMNYALISPGAENANDKNGDNIMPYPIIRLSDIRANPRQTVQDTSAAFECLVKVASKIYESKVHPEHVEEIANEMVAFSNTLVPISQQLLTDITQLREWNDIYSQRPVTSDVDRDKMNKIQHNLAVRYEGLLDLMRIISRIAQIEPQLVAIVNDLRATRELIVARYQGLGTIL